MLVCEIIYFVIHLMRLLVMIVLMIVGVLTMGLRQGIIRKETWGPRMAIHVEMEGPCINVFNSQWK